MNLIAARIKDNELVAEIDKYQNGDQHFHLWWFGQSGFLLQWNGERMLLDPYLSDSLTEKYRSTDKPHVRMSERVIDPSLLRNISIVTSSHNHTDHLDAETLRPIFSNNPGVTFIIPEANREFVTERTKQSLDFPVGLNAGESFSKGHFTLHGIPAAHNEIELDQNGRHKYMGYVIQFGKWSVYHSGDTLWFDQLPGLLKPFDLDLAILPINGNDPSRRVAGNLNTSEAARLGRESGARMVIPCHYDMFTFNTANPVDFASHATQIGQPYTILPQGGHFSSESIITGLQ
jgi:L-ascorbate metabolism protein UlaG (beta-lactamase superfamily)